MSFLHFSLPAALLLLLSVIVHISCISKTVIAPALINAKRISFILHSSYIIHSELSCRGEQTSIYLVLKNERLPFLQVSGG